MAKNGNLHIARSDKNDEFYTQYHDIEQEMNSYLDYNPDVFRGKTVLLPCDDPEWSNFTKYFAARFEHLGLKKLISTSYAPNNKRHNVDNFSYVPSDMERNSFQFDAEKSMTRGKIFVLTEDMNRDGRINIQDLGWSYLEGDGDFRSKEVTALRDEADIIITNPPFSIFREFMAWVLEGGKAFAAIGSMNAITYKDIFPLICSNTIWIGVHPVKSFITPQGDVQQFGNVCWYANIEHGRRHQPLSLMTMKDNLKFNKKMKGKVAYDRYDGQEEIDVSFTNAIPSDYDGVMGVPISFLDKYCPEQFEILGIANSARWIGYRCKTVINGEKIYNRILIRHKR